MNAPLNVGVRVGRGKDKGRSVLNVLDFNLCADCKMLRDNTHTHIGDTFRKLRFLFGHMF